MVQPFGQLKPTYIKLDPVNGSKLRFGGQIRNLRRMNHFEKFNKANRIFFAENARFFEYYVRILALKVGDNLI